MSDLDTHAKAGIAAINERRYEDAVREFQAALAIDDGRPDLNSALGMAYLQRGEVGSAIPHLEKAVALSEPFDAPEHQEMKLHFRVGLASAYEMADQIGDARRTLQATVAKWPQQPEPQLQLAHLLFKTGAIDEGLTAYRAAADHLDDEGKKVVKAVIEAVARVTHIALPDDRGMIIGAEVQAPGVIYYDMKKLFLCGGFSDAEFQTTTEVYPDSPKVNAQMCDDAQVAAICGGLDFIK
jgi:tetratricopeptide (TPR) repeat protein